MNQAVLSNLRNHSWLPDTPLTFVHFQHHDVIPKAGYHPANNDIFGFVVLNSPTRVKNPIFPSGRVPTGRNEEGGPR